MGALQRLERRNQDFLLLETIKQVGVQNYSLLARLTGLNAETIRYKVSKHMTKLGLNATIRVNYGELGLAVAYLFVTPKQGSGKSWLDEMSYIIFSGKLMGTNKYFCLCALPFRFKKKFNGVLEGIRTKGLIEDYEIADLAWMRYPPFRVEMYDFEGRAWKMDWNRLGLPLKEVGPSFLSVNRDSVVDYIDLKILKAMLVDPAIPIAKAAKAIQANPRTVRYHHTEHVMKGRFILSNDIRWVRPPQDGGVEKLIQAVIIFRKLDQAAAEKVRRFCNNLPFTWLEAGTEDRTYLALVDIPINIFQESIREIESHLRTQGDNYEVIMLDPSGTRPLDIPDEMFDKERGWRLLNYQEPGASQAEELPN
jgi:DNA-binding Lrp family transcriptional regulator